MARFNTLSTQLWQEWERAGSAGEASSVEVAVCDGVVYLVAQHDQPCGRRPVIDPYHTSRYHGNTESLNYPQSLSITVL